MLKMGCVTNVIILSLHSINRIQIQDRKCRQAWVEQKKIPNIISGSNMAEYKTPVTAPDAPTALYP
jgi:hypothetical protein